MQGNYGWLHIGSQKEIRSSATKKTKMLAAQAPYYQVYSQETYITYGKITETELNDNQNILNEASDTTITIDKYFERIEYCIQYADYGKQQYPASRIINNAYNTLLDMGMYKEPRNMCPKKLLSEEKWDDFKNFFAEEYHDLCKI